MSNSQKAVFAVLILVALLFVVAMVVGLGGDDGGGFPSASEVPGWIEGLGGLFASPAALRLRHLQAASQPSCLQAESLRLSRGQVCEVRVPASSAPVRRACLELARGGEVKVTLTQPGTVPARGTLRPGKGVKIEVFEQEEAAALLRLECRPVPGNQNGCEALLAGAESCGT